MTTPRRANAPSAATRSSPGWHGVASLKELGGNHDSLFPFLYFFKNKIKVVAVLVALARIPHQRALLRAHSTAGARVGCERHGIVPACVVRHQRLALGAVSDQALRADIPMVSNFCYIRDDDHLQFLLHFHLAMHIDNKYTFPYWPIMRRRREPAQGEGCRRSRGPSQTQRQPSRRENAGIS